MTAKGKPKALDRKVKDSDSWRYVEDNRGLAADCQVVVCRRRARWWAALASWAKTPLGAGVSHALGVGGWWTRASSDLFGPVSYAVVAILLSVFRSLWRGGGPDWAYCHGSLPPSDEEIGNAVNLVHRSFLTVDGGRFRGTQCGGVANTDLAYAGWVLHKGHELPALRNYLWDRVRFALNFTRRLDRSTKLTGAPSRALFGTQRLGLRPSLVTSLLLIAFVGGWLTRDAETFAPVSFGGKAQWGGWRSGSPRGRG